MSRNVHQSAVTYQVRGKGPSFDAKRLGAYVRSMHKARRDGDHYAAHFENEARTIAAHLIAGVPCEA